MKKAIKIFGIGAAVLLVMTIFIPLVSSGEDPIYYPFGTGEYWPGGDCEALIAEKEALEQEREDLECELLDLDDELNTLLARLAQLEEQLIILQQKKEKLLEERSKIQSKISKVKWAIQNAIDQIGSYHETKFMDPSGRGVPGLGAGGIIRLGYLYPYLKILEKKLSKINQQIEEINAKIQDILNEIAAIQTRINEILNRMAEIEDRLQAIDARLDEINQLLALYCQNYINNCPCELD